MCRWGCITTDTTYMCKWCGTRYCRECLMGDFPGLMKEPAKCRICNQIRCQGKRVEYYPPPKDADGSRSRSAAKGGTKTGSSARRSKSAPTGGKGKKKKKKRK